MLTPPWFLKHRLRCPSWGQNVVLGTATALCLRPHDDMPAALLWSQKGLVLNSQDLGIS